MDPVTELQADEAPGHTADQEKRDTDARQLAVGDDAISLALMRAPTSSGLLMLHDDVDANVVALDLEEVS